MDSSASERVGRYQLLEPIGIGPNGSVSRAKVFGVAGFERQFAVKKFFPELTITASMAQTLSQAARAYGGLEHPRIARMAEFGVAGGTTFTAVEYVTGLDALRLITETRLAGMTLPVGGALGLVSQAARAIGYAHGRGLSHLGLSPTNVIISADGDIKITDFNILQATLPPRTVAGPWQDGPIGGLIASRLANRVMYLAPEQIAGEPTSAATDVWSLGVLGLELVTGQRAFKGDSPMAIANAIMESTPPEPNLPRPIVRVLQRCLARSPFERFPDARALADAIDAALRVAPVPGTRKDLGALVGEMLDRIAALHDGEMSGVLAITPGTGPFRREQMPEVPTLGRETDLSTSEFVRPDLNVPGPAPLTGPKAPQTIPGLAMPATPPPPPIPTPGSRPTTNPPPIPRPMGQTLMGVPSVPALPRAPTSQRFVNPITNTGVGPTPRAPGRASSEMSIAMEADEPPPVPPRTRSQPNTAEIAPGPAQMLGEASMLPTTEIEPLARAAREDIASPPPEPPEFELPPPPAVDQLVITKSKLPWVLGGLFVAGGLGFVIWQLTRVTGEPDKVVVAKADAGVIAPPPADATKVAAAVVDATAAAAKPDAAAAIATVPTDAAADAPARVAVVVDAAAPPDAAPVKVASVDAGVVVPVAPTGDPGSLVVDSRPSGARVFLDGKDVGQTPLKLAAMPAKHNLALILEKHDLYVASIDGHGTFTIPLADVPAWKGNAGIKLLKCAANRYYVYVDGKPTGMTCPTERINTTMGPHVVEVYDTATDQKKKWDVVVPDERLSFRVRVEP